MRTQLKMTFDGDTVSVNSVYLNESVAEIKQYFKTRRAYMRAGGGIAFSVNIHTVNLAMRNLTGHPL